MPFTNFHRTPHLVAVFLFSTSAFLRSLHAAPALDLRPTAEPPVIDGHLDDPAWRTAAHSDAFRQVYPAENVAPSEHTEFWVTFDAANLYVAVRCHDSAGLAGIRAYSMEHDQYNSSDDQVRIVIDTFHRQSDGYYFDLTAAGGRHEGLVQNKAFPNEQWDAIWFGRVTRDPTGWSAEFAIPFKSLAFDPANTTWGFDVSRIIRRTQEQMRWANLIRAKPMVSLPNTGELRGLVGLHQDLGLEFKPFASLSTRSDPASGTSHTDFKPGLDFVWHVTPALAATFTLNTDFADAEVDERQINLGRFPLFFPEKRSFFTQDASLFTFADIDQDPLPFFSRRIGLAPDGSPIDLLGGAKLTGRSGPWTLGLLDVQTASGAGIASQNLFVARVAHQIFAESSIGLIATHGDPTGFSENTLLGLDFNFVRDRPAGEKSLRVTGGLQGTDSTAAGGRGTAATLTIEFPNDPFYASATFSRIDDRFDPALGFVSRTGIVHGDILTQYNFYRQAGPIRLLQPFTEFDYTRRLSLAPLDGNHWLGLYVENPAGDFLNLWIAHHYETYDDPFEIRPGIVVPTGRHIWDNLQIEIGSTRSRPFDAYIRWRPGGYLTGHADFYSLNFGWRPSGHFQLTARSGLNDIRLPEGHFQVRSGSVRLAYTFTPDLQASLFTQYDNFSDSLGLNFRLKWTARPGADFFLVFNQGYDTSEDSIRPTARDASIKGSWTFRF